jgi:hypothetical protein|tara:strand:- start:3948 stop:4172 length:225 start_codon:yes stop_codon:yes gene_type:complete
MLNTKSPKEFSQEIETFAKENKLQYMEAIIEYCEKTNLEPEVAGSLLSPILKKKLQYEAEKLNLIPKTTEELPL